MTKKQAIAKIRKMAAEQRKTLLKECERLLNSGGVDVDGAENNFLLPKTILHVALLNEANQYKPLTKQTQTDAKNLLKF